MPDEVIQLKVSPSGEAAIPTKNMRYFLQKELDIIPPNCPGNDTHVFLEAKPHS
jgi:hypothetical protein